MDSLKEASSTKMLMDTIRAMINSWNFLHFQFKFQMKGIVHFYSQQKTKGQNFEIKMHFSKWFV